MMPFQGVRGFRGVYDRRRRSIMGDVMAPSLHGQASVAPESHPETLVVFTIETTRLAIDAAAVERVLEAAELSPLPGAPPAVAGVINIHGALVPVLDLRPRLKAAPREPRLDAKLLLINAPRGPVAIEVDEVLDVVTIDQESISSGTSLIAGTSFLKGIATVPDGLILIQDVERLFNGEEEAVLDRALAQGARA
jgi:purine-binding chemotaxis protein CheW